MERGRKLAGRWRARFLPFACASAKRGEVTAAQAADGGSAPILGFSVKSVLGQLCVEQEDRAAARGLIV
jgi:hypothetical protein